MNSLLDKGLLELYEVEITNGKLRDCHEINITIMHLIFEPYFAAPQSSNPLRSPATPAVCLNRTDKIRPKSERLICHTYFMTVPYG